MKKIIELLDTRKLQGQEKALALYYLDKFAPYAGDEQLAARNRQFNVPDRDVAVTYSYTTNSYNRTKARQYIDRYWNSYNPDFPNLTYIGGDCTNFASQVLHAGNLPMDYRGGWYVYPKQIPPRYPAPKSIGELNYSWSLADPSSWISAKQFNRYWSQHVYSKERYSGTELKNLQTFDDVWRKAWHGDVVQILRPVWWWYEPYHTLEVYSFTFISSKDIILAAHTNNTKSLSFKEIINRYPNYKFDIFYVKQGY
ncbi:MAG: amidase domain-containing protein [Brockia lithotrophica]|nr:amidase domain-containing protein [Brockia lithotrophica]